MSSAFDTSIPLVHAFGLAAAASLITWAFLTKRQQESGAPSRSQQSKNPDLGWLQALYQDGEKKRVRLREWEDPSFRKDGGWQGNDLIHHAEGKAVRILAYFWDTKLQSLVGAVHFGPNAESHAGLCHGGSMCSAMDDVLGWTAFMAGTGPWCGATVQVNCSLKKPVAVGQLMKIESKVVRSERKKVFITAILSDEAGVVYAELDGIAISGVKIGNKGPLSDREWEVGKDICA